MRCLQVERLIAALGELKAEDLSELPVRFAVKSTYGEAGREKEGEGGRGRGGEERDMGRDRKEKGEDTS